MASSNKNNGNGGNSLDITTFRCSQTQSMLWVLIKWFKGEMYSIQPSDTVVSRDILEDPDKVGYIYYIGEGLAALKPPYQGARICLGRVLDASENRTALECKLTGMLRNGLLTKIVEMSKKEQHSIEWRQQNSLFQDDGQHATSATVEVQQLKSTVKKLKEELRSQRTEFEERFSKIEAKLLELSGKELVPTAEAEFLANSVEDDTNHELLEMETALLQYITQMDLLVAKGTPCYKKMTTILLESVFGVELLNSSLTRLDPMRVDLITRYIFALRCSDPSCSVSSIRWKIRKYIDNKNTYNKRKSASNNDIKPKRQAVESILYAAGAEAATTSDENLSDGFEEL